MATNWDDGVTVTAGSVADTRANIDKFLNGELVKNEDVIIWYGAHFKHDQGSRGRKPYSGPRHQACEVVNPDMTQSVTGEAITDMVLENSQKTRVHDKLRPTLLSGLHRWESM